ncbi:MAG: hypothetical protein IPJ88_05035 [Myxococcales bacterium]|nr:MAG: hypothetical protein IPJ88_05035 [Myxococcales bacterium]
MQEATVRLLGEVNTDEPGIRTELRRSVVTDAVGKAVIDILPGSYTVVVIPPAGESSLTIFTEQIEIDADGIVGVGSEKSVLLNERVQYSGFVSGAGGQAMRGATVQAQAQKSDEGLTDLLSALFNRSVQSQTDTDGIFYLDLDYGRYDIVVQSREDSGFPWVVLKNQVVYTDFDASAFKTIELPEPQVISGTVFNAEDVGISAAALVVHGVVMDGEKQRLIQVGSASSDENGGV